MPTLVILVAGTPAPQGSKRHVGGGRMVEASKRVPAWREAVRHNTELAAERHEWIPADGAVTVTVVFTMPRPRGHYGTGRNAQRLRNAAPAEPLGPPDLDKLARATLDGLTDSGTITDDARVTHLTAVKCYPGGDLDALDTPGAAIVITTDEAPP